MKVQELFQRLSYGPMSNLSIGNNGSGDIVDAKKPAIVLYANDALLRLHTRFVLVEDSLVVVQADGVTAYDLVSTNANIQGTFNDNLIKILRVINSSGYPLPLNDEKNCGSLFTPQNHILQIPNPVAGDLVQVVYQARHPKLEFESVDSNADISIPETLEEAMIAYISYLHYSSMNGQENVARAAEYFSRYNAICSEAENRGVVNTDDTPGNSKFEQKGFI